VCIGVGIIPSWSWQGCLCQRCSRLPLAGPAELFQLVADHIEEVTRPLRDEAAASKLWVASAAGSWEHAEAASAGGVGRAPVRASDARLRDAELLEFVGSCLPIHRFYGSSPLVCLLLALMWGQTIIYLVMCSARSVAPVLCLFSQMHL
jgi:hypothetical protein